MRRECASNFEVTLRLWIEITCNSEITTREHDVYPQTARVFPLGTISWRSSLNPHARNQRSVQSRCCHVRFSERYNNICSLFRKKYWVHFCSVETKSWIFPTVAKHKIDGTLMLLRQKIARSIAGNINCYLFKMNWNSPSFWSIYRHAKLTYYLIKAKHSPSDMLF